MTGSFAVSSACSSESSELCRLFSRQHRSTVVRMGLDQALLAILGRARPISRLAHYIFNSKISCWRSSMAWSASSERLAITESAILEEFEHRLMGHP